MKQSKLIFTLLASVFLIGLLVTKSYATPLRMDYSVADAGGGLYEYSFSLILDNNDGSWAAGQEWDWIVFGSGGSGDSPFADAGSTSGFDWTWGTTAAGFTGQFSYGAYDGPTVAVGDSVVLPGWVPSAIGDSISFSGTSSILVAEADMFWSSLVTGGGARPVYDHQANLTRVPEPSTVALFALALFGLGYMRRQANQSA